MVIIIMGVSGAGKTTVGRLLSAKLKCDFLDADDFHSPENRLKMERGIPLSDADREPWLDRLAGIIQKYKSADTVLVLACSLLREKYRKRLGVDQRDVRTVYLKGTRDELQKRLASRNHPFFNPTLLDDQLATLEEPTGGLIFSIHQSPDEIVKLVSVSLR